MAQPYLDQLQELVSPNCDLYDEMTCKHFFSGAALYFNDRICASYTLKGLAFKLPLERCDELISQGRAVPLRYFNKSPVKKGYVLLPDWEKLSNTEISNYLLECVAHASKIGV